MKRKLTYVLLLFPFCGFAQKVSEELLKVRQAYLNASNFSADVEVTGYADKSSNTTVPIGKGIVRKNADSYYSKFGTDEMISNKNCTIIIDNYEKSVMWFSSTKIPKKQKQNNGFSNINIDTLMKLNDSVVYRGMEGGMKKISFFNKKADVIQTDIFVDPATYFVNKIIYIYKEADIENDYEMHKVVIVYKNITTKKISEEIFSEKKYLSMVKSKPQLSNAYKNYKLIVVPNEEL